MYDKSPSLMTSTQKSLLKITAPPSGNRKCLVFCTSYTLMYSSWSIDHNHVKHFHKGLKTLMMQSYGNCEFTAVWRQSLMIANKEGFIITPLCIDSSSQCHLLGTGSDMFYSLMHCSWMLYSSDELRQVIGPWSELWHFLKPCKHWRLILRQRLIKVVITHNCIVQ